MGWQDVRSFYEDPPDSEDLRRASVPKCPECDGTGERRAHVRGDSEDDDEAIDPCVACGGTGEATDEQIREMADEEDRLAATVEANIALMEARYAASDAEALTDPPAPAEPPAR